MSGRTNRNKQIRMDEELFQRVQRLVGMSGLSESDVLRLALKAGLPRLESGEVNPFSSTNIVPIEGIGAQHPRKAAEEPPEYGAGR